MPMMKKGIPKLSPFAQMLRDKREKLAPHATLREFCAARGLEPSFIEGMEHDRRTAPGTYGALYKLASGYGHGPTDRWTLDLLDAALGKAPARPTKPAADRRVAPTRGSGAARKVARATPTGTRSTSTRPSGVRRG